MEAKKNVLTLKDTKMDHPQCILQSTFLKSHCSKSLIIVVQKFSLDKTLYFETYLNFCAKIRSCNFGQKMKVLNTHCQKISNCVQKFNFQTNTKIVSLNFCAKNERIFVIMIH